MGGIIMSKKQLIIENAVYLFSKQGFEQTSIQQITDRAGISKGAFYLSFKSKDELIISLIEYFMNNLLIEIEQVVNSNKENKLQAYINALFSNIQRNAFFAKILLNEKPACLDPTILEKVQLYYSLITQALVSIIKEQYTNMEKDLVPELVFLIQSLTTCYGKLFFQENREIELNELVENVFEKINILANQFSSKFITYSDIKLISEIKITKEQLIEEIHEHLMNVENADVKEVLELLKMQLLQQTYPMPVIYGLLSLLKDHQETSGFAVLATFYYKGQK